MKIQEFIDIMETIAPPYLKESYDNVGLMVGDSNSEVTKILVALDCTKAVIEEAKEVGAELILSHHPLLFRKPSSITGDTLQGEKIRSLIKNDTALYSSHTNWDSVAGGLNEEFARILGFESSKLIEVNKNDSKSGIGRIVEFEEAKQLSEVISLVKDKFNLEHLRYAGELDKMIKRIALINGSGQDFFEAAYRSGVDLVITGDTTYHFVSDYSEMGMAIMDIGHFNSEWPLVKRLSERVSDELKKYNVSVIISKTVKDPYNFI